MAALAGSGDLTDSPDRFTGVEPMHASHATQQTAATTSVEIVPVRINTGRIDDDRAWHRIGLLMRSGMLLALAIGTWAWAVSNTQSLMPGNAQERSSTTPVMMGHALAERAP